MTSVPFVDDTLLLGTGLLALSFAAQRRSSLFTFAMKGAGFVLGYLAACALGRASGSVVMGLPLMCAGGALVSAQSRGRAILPVLVCGALCGAAALVMPSGATLSPLILSTACALVLATGQGGSKFILPTRWPLSTLGLGVCVILALLSLVIRLDLLPGLALIVGLGYGRFVAGSRGVSLGGLAMLAVLLGHIVLPNSPIIGSPLWAVGLALGSIVLVQLSQRVMRLCSVAMLPAICAIFGMIAVFEYGWPGIGNALFALVLVSMGGMAIRLWQTRPAQFPAFGEKTMTHGFNHAKRAAEGVQQAAGMAAVVALNLARSKAEPSATPALASILINDKDNLQTLSQRIDGLRPPLPLPIGPADRVAYPSPLRKRNIVVPGEYLALPPPEPQVDLPTP